MIALFSVCSLTESLLPVTLPLLTIYTDRNSVTSGQSVNAFSHVTLNDYYCWQGYSYLWCVFYALFSNSALKILYSSHFNVLWHPRLSYKYPFKSFVAIQNVCKFRKVSKNKKKTGSFHFSSYFDSISISSAIASYKVLK